MNQLSDLNDSNLMVTLKALAALGFLVAMGFGTFFIVYNLA